MLTNVLLNLRAAYAAKGPSKAMLRQLSGVALLQALQMLISAATGFLIIRHLAKEDYAIFTLLNLGTSNVTSWAGFSIATIFIAFANRVGKSADELRATTEIFRRLNFPLLVVGILAAMALWIISAVSNGWMDTKYAVGVLIALAVAICQYEYRFPESAFKVSGQPILPFKIAVRSDLIRLALSLPLVLIVLPLLPAGLGPVLLTAILLCTSLLSLVSAYRRFHNLRPSPNQVTAAHKAEYWGLIRPLLFPEYFYQISQFLRSWLIFLISGKAVIAEAAALGRLMVLFAMMDKAVEMVVLPRLGSIKQEGQFVTRLLMSCAGVASIGLMLLFSAWAFPGFWLWILGEKYTNLGNALLWAVAAAGIERLSGLVLYAQLARGQTKNQWWVPVFASAVYIAYAVIVGLNTAENATKALFLSSCSNLLAQIGIFTWRLRRGQSAPSS